MTDYKLNTAADTPPEPENEIYPIEPRYHPIHKIPRKVYGFLASSKLAMFLLVVILISCVAGVTIVRGDRAWFLIFNSLWFNALLVLLVVNIACCFFGRIWGRRVTVISFGMILFHLSFVTMLGGIVYNSLYYFRGNIRLTESEVLSSGDPTSYDTIDKGRLFNFTRLKGETSLIKLHTGYKVNGADKRAAYEVVVGEGVDKKHEIIYITHKLTHNGVDYFNDKEGYSLLITLSDAKLRELYGAYLPLQSIPQKLNEYLYTTGHKVGQSVMADSIRFPVPPAKSFFALQVTYLPNKQVERSGEARFQITALDEKGVPLKGTPIADGKAAIGESFAFGKYVLSAQEVRYWVGMAVRYEPGKPIVLASLWVGLMGMIITTTGRMFKKTHVKNPQGDNVGRC